MLFLLNEVEKKKIDKRIERIKKQLLIACGIALLVIIIFIVWGANMETKSPRNIAGLFILCFFGLARVFLIPARNSIAAKAIKLKFVSEIIFQNGEIVVKTYNNAPPSIQGGKMLTKKHFPPLFVYFFNEGFSLNQSTPEGSVYQFMIGNKKTYIVPVLFNDPFLLLRYLEKQQ